MLNLVILNYNRHLSTEALLGDLRSCRGEFRVLLVENGSRPEDAQALRKFVDLGSFPYSIDWLDSSINLGFTGGVNLALRHGLSKYTAEDDLYVLLNNDLRIHDQGLFEKLTEVFVSRPDIGILGPVIRSGTDTPTGIQSTGWIQLRTGSTLLDFHVPKETLAECEFVHGCCFAIRARVLRELGILDDDYHAYYEEADLCAKALKAGWKTAVLRDAEVGHEGSATTGLVSPFREFLMIRNRFLFVRKNGSRAQLAATALHVLFLRAPKRTVRILLDRDPKRLRWYWKGVLFGLLGRSGRSGVPIG